MVRTRTANGKEPSDIAQKEGDDLEHQDQDQAQEHEQHEDQDAALTSVADVVLQASDASLLPVYVAMPSDAFTPTHAASSAAAAAGASSPTSSINVHSSGLLTTTGAPPRFPPFQESYADMRELRKELKVFSVKLNAPYFMHHSSPQRLEARCPTWKTRKDVPSTCEFVVAANRHTNGRVYVTRAVVSHSPGCPAVQHTGNYISAAALMETAKPFMEKMADSAKPRDMANIMKEQFGVSTSYMTAWRALSAFRHERKVAESASFARIRGYLDAFVEHNAGSVAVFEHVPNATVFSRAFLCPQAMQASLKYCRPALLLSTFIITSAYGGVVMAATAQDAMGDNVPIAVGVALAESAENWRFFLEQLVAALPDFATTITTIVHTRGEVLQQSLAEVLPGCTQSPNVNEFFTRRVQAIQDPALASEAQSNAASVNTNSLAWLEALCTKSPLMILVGWVSKVASTLFQRFEMYGKMTSEYPDDFNALLAQYEAEGAHFDVLRVSEQVYEVIDQHSGRQRIVDFAKRTCSCGEYAPSRFPCLHIFLAMSSTGVSHSDVIPEIFLMTSLKSLYSGRVTPIDVETVSSDGVTIPHPLPKTRGRPRKIQQIQQSTGPKHEKLACSVCGVRGHNKRTCKKLTGLQASGLATDSVDEPVFIDASAYETSELLSVETTDAQTSPRSAKRRRVDEKSEPSIGDATIV